MENHEAAIRLLMHQILPIERLSSARRPIDLIIQPDILDLSCGTGTIIRILEDILSLRRARELRITANDLSDDMKEIAREKLRGFPGRVEFTGQDLTKLEMGREFGTIFLSQTLHLITDEDVVRQERQANYLHVDSDRHFEAKMGALLRAWGHLRVGGTMVVVDEWPALLSDRGGPLGAGFAYLFNDSLREISYMDFSFALMSQLPGSSLVAHLKAPIDSKHGMYVMVYRKRKWDRENPMVLPENDEFDALRKNALRRNLVIFRAINNRFIDGFEVPDGDPWVRFRNMNPKKTFTMREGQIPQGDRKYSCVVIDRMLQQLPGSRRHEILRAAINSLKVGGSLLILDEWPSGLMHGHPIRIQDLRTMYMKRYAKNLVYGGAVRVPIHDHYDSGIFGFQFWKVM
jgi:SAM-dependent methyltransferase